MHRAPEASEYTDAYAGYVAQVADVEDIVAVLTQQRQELAALATSVGPHRENHRYAAGKWSVREVVGHLGDAERVFGYRTFCVSRAEQQPLPSFDENTYVAHSAAAERPLADLVAELLLLRDANLVMLRQLREEAWSRSGVANNQPITARALAYVIAGHCRHHLGILRDRYGVP